MTEGMKDAPRTKEAIIHDSLESMLELLLETCDEKVPESLSDSSVSEDEIKLDDSDDSDVDEDSFLVVRRFPRKGEEIFLVAFLFGVSDGWRREREEPTAFDWVCCGVALGVRRSRLEAASLSDSLVDFESNDDE